MKELAPFTDAQLIEELARRQNACAPALPTQWCEDCVHFKTSPAATDRYNPCQKRHAMQFYIDHSTSDPDPIFGYYRTVCTDRKPRQQEETV